MTWMGLTKLLCLNIMCSTTGQPSASIVLGEIVLAHIHKEATELSPTGQGKILIMFSTDCWP
jgi:hypothetical protein